LQLDAARILALLVFAYGACTTGCSQILSKDGLSDGGAGGSSGACGSFAHAAVSSLSDDFGNGSAAPNWNPIGGGCVHEAGGQLVAAPVASDDFCYYESVDPFHLSCDELAVKVPQAATQVVGVQTFIYLTPDDGSDPLILLLEDNEFSWGTESGSGNVAISGQYDSTTDVWWKLRETGGEQIFETSLDGSNWDERGRGANLISLDAVRVGIGAGAWQSVPTPGNARFDCYNMPAPCP
jgi:hypothetical protein